MALSESKKRKRGKRRVSGPWKVPQIKESGPKLPKIISGGPSFQPTKADDRGYAGGGGARYRGKGSGSRGGVTPTPKGDGKPKGIPRFSTTPAFTPTKADDRGYRKGGRLRTEYAKGGPGKFRYELDGDLDKTGRAGYAGGGTLASMRKNIIGIKKDRGLTAKSGPRKGMTKKRARTRYAGGGTLASMRKNIIGIKKDRGLTAKSGARTGMTKKRATGRGGR